MQWIPNIFWKCWNLIYGISEKCQKFIVQKILEIKSQHLTWDGPIITDKIRSTLLNDEYGGYGILLLTSLVKWKCTLAAADN